MADFKVEANWSERSVMMNDEDIVDVAQQRWIICLILYFMGKYIITHHEVCRHRHHPAATYHPSARIFVHLSPPHW